MVVKTEVCSYSGFRIYPGHGIKYVRGDSKSFLFINRKSKSYFHQKFNPRKIAWTLLYRRMHKKGTLEDTQKKTKRKVSKGAPKAVVGASLELIKQKRNQKPEVRAAAREAALREIKERAKAKQVGPPPNRRLVQCTVHRRMRSGALHTRACMRASMRSGLQVLCHSPVMLPRAPGPWAQWRTLPSPFAGGEEEGGCEAAAGGEEAAGAEGRQAVEGQAAEGRQALDSCMVPRVVRWLKVFMPGVSR